MSYPLGTSAIRTLAGAGCLALLGGTAAAADLVSVKVATPIAIDGSVEAAWEQAPPCKIVLDKTPYKPEGFAGITQTEVTLRSAYDAEHVYLLVQYKDPTQSLARAPWVKQADGSWKQARKPDATGHENSNWEDKFAILWDINAKGFPKLGCAVVCHMSVGGKVNGVADTSPGRKFTKEGQTVDLWCWEAMRSAAVGQADDMYINDNNPPDAADWGRRGDAGEGGYVDNVNAAKTGPAFMPTTPGQAWIADDQKAPFADTFKPGDAIPSVIVKPYTGSRGDIACAAKWADGAWTIELKRKLVTAGDKAAEQDVQFSDLGKAYPFGIAVFDNAEINHVYHAGTPKLTFKP